MGGSQYRSEWKWAFHGGLDARKCSLRRRTRVNLNEPHLLSNCLRIEHASLQWLSGQEHFHQGFLLNLQSKTEQALIHKWTHKMVLLCLQQSQWVHLHHFLSRTMRSALCFSAALHRSIVASPSNLRILYLRTSPNWRLLGSHCVSFSWTRKCLRASQSTSRGTSWTSCP